MDGSDNAHKYYVLARDIVFEEKIELSWWKLSIYRSNLLNELSNNGASTSS